MSNSATATQRVAWMDGLRGVAATQVVLLHYASAFLPGIGLPDHQNLHYYWENAFIRTPLFVLFDGYSAVYIFFVLSGVALTYSFGARPYAITSSIVRRILRLGIPMTAAVLLGAMWYGWWPDAHVAASRITQSSTWLAVVGPVQISLPSIAHQIGLEGMLAGYNGVSVLPARSQTTLGLAFIAQSFDGPLWTLHIEFIGSLIVLALVALRQAVGHRTHVIICLLLIGALPSSFLVLFVVGHLAANWLRTPAELRRNLALGVGLLALGVLLCTSQTLGIMSALRKFFPTPFISRREAPEVIQVMYGAIAVFFGIACLPRIQSALARPAFRWLGKISFSLYLTHFPLLFSAVSAGFVVLAARLAYFSAIATVTVVGCLFSLVLAVAFEALVDRPAIGLSRWAFQRLEHRRGRAREFTPP
jgi:peptidoglycan/LPS O-acetylase OafA/YrhL